MRAVVERETNQRSSNTIDSMKAAIIRIMNNINMDHVMRVCYRFRSPIEAIIASVGGYIE